MPAPKVRANHEALNQIARSFTKQADAMRRTLGALKVRLEVLRNGDWVGKGAGKFYKEMDAQVMPSLQRLIAALERASTITIKSSQIMKQAEEDAARLFRLEAGAGSIGIPASAALTSPVASSGRPVAAFAAPAPSGASKDETPGYASYKSAADGAGGGVVGRMLRPLSPRVRELAARSPTLLKNLSRAERLGYKIAMGPEGRGTYKEGKTIILARGAGELDQVSMVAHEVAHAAKGQHVFINPVDLPITKAEWVNLQTRINLDGEGNAVMHQAIAREEILTAGGPDIGIWADEDGAYLRIYNEWRSGQETWDSAVHRAGQLYAEEQPSDSPVETKYRDYYAKGWADYWDAEIEPARRVRQ